MVTVSRSNAFQRNLLLSIGGVFLIFAICFCIYQYQREREYKIDILHARLQMYNYDIMQVLGEDGITSRQQFLGYVRPIILGELKFNRHCAMAMASTSSARRSPPTRPISTPPHASSASSCAPPCLILLS